MRILLLLTFLFVSQFAFAEYNTVDYSNIVGDTGNYINALDNLVGKGIVAQLTIGIVSLSIILLGLASFRMLVRHMIQKKEDKASVFGLGFNVMLILTAVTRPAIIGFSLVACVFMTASFTAAVAPSFTKSSYLDKTKILHDKRIEALAYAYDLAERSVFYHFYKAQFQREMVFDYRNERFNNCVEPYGPYTLVVNTGVVIDTQATNLQQCSRRFGGMKSLKFGAIKFDKKQSEAFNARVISYQNELRKLADIIIASECAKNVNDLDENDYLKNCSLMENGKVVVIENSSDYVVKEIGQIYTNEQLQAYVKYLANDFADKVVSEIEVIINEEDKKLTEEIKSKSSWNPFDIINATYNASKLRFIIKEKADAVIYSNSVEVEYAKIINPTYEKTRYTLDKYLNDGEQSNDDFDIKRTIENLFAEMKFGDELISSSVSKAVNSVSGNIFNDNGYSGAECLEDHSKCNISSFNIPANSIDFANKSLVNHLETSVVFNTVANVMKSIAKDIDNITAKKSVIFVSAVFEAKATYHQWMFFIVLTSMITMMLIVVLPIIGHALEILSLAFSQSIISVLEVFKAFYKKDIDSIEFDLDWINVPIAILVIGPLVVISMIMSYWGYHVASIVISFTGHVFVQTHVQLNNLILIELVSHIIFYITMTFTFIKVRSASDQYFVVMVVRAILKKIQYQADKFVDLAEKGLTQAINKIK
ncbi:MAG: hypothetical protein VCB24_00555 [Pseudomonas sp.]|uniref:hypothetical protein n=1 Tax=Pseudomonas sp. TaxID=306 RepID=UPI0039828E03